MAQVMAQIMVQFMVQVMPQANVKFIGLPLFLMHFPCVWPLLPLPHWSEDTKT
jgi:hypothetical protein